MTEVGRLGPARVVFDQRSAQRQIALSALLGTREERPEQADRVASPAGADQQDGEGELRRTKLSSAGAKLGSSCKRAPETTRTPDRASRLALRDAEVIEVPGGRLHSDQTHIQLLGHSNRPVSIARTASI